METTEPISRKLIHLAKIYLNVLSKKVDHLGVKRYHYVLSLIHAHNGRLTQKALAQMLGKDKSALVSIIDSLTEKGYIYREVNPADRREHLLKTTAKATRVMPEIVGAFEAINEMAINNISAEEIETAIIGRVLWGLKRL